MEDAYFAAFTRAEQAAHLELSRRAAVLGGAAAKAQVRPHRNATEVVVAARDLASRLIRVNTIAPGVFDTPMLARLRPDIREALEKSVPHPSRLGSPDDYAQMALALLENSYVNGETVRLDGAIRMPPR